MENTVLNTEIAAEKLATLCYDENTSTYSLEFDNVIIGKSIGGDKARDYLINRFDGGHYSKVHQLGITGISNRPAPAKKTNLFSGTPLAPRPAHINTLLTVDERYEMLDECVDIMTNSSKIRSLIITGEGSLGKTFAVKAGLKRAGLISTEEAAEKAKIISDHHKEIIKQIEAKLVECQQKAEKFYEDEELEIQFTDHKYDLHLSKIANDRLCAGQFCGSHYRFNLILAEENLDEFLSQVVPHEFAHHVNRILNPKAKASHGKEWKAIMKDCMDLNPDRYHEMDTTNVNEEIIELEGDYHYVKGYTSPKGLFRTLYENRSKKIVFDDCDAAWQTDVGANILKAALDTDEQRIVSWNVESTIDNGLPKSFEFTGQVIFISNVASSEFPDALKTRALRVELDMTIEERFERINKILHSDFFSVGSTTETKQMAYDFLWENKHHAKEISSRSLLNIISVIETGSKLWKRIALSNIG